MKIDLPFIDRIWRVRSSLALSDPMSPAEAFEKLDPLFNVEGTEHLVEGNRLFYKKDNPAAQDRMATFTKGTLEVVQSESGGQLKYDLSSPALFFTFLAPLLFFGFAQLAVFLNDLEKPAIEETAEAEEEDKEDEEKVELHWIDTMLGAPAPKQPGDDESSEEGRGEDEEEKDKDEHSPTPAYVLAALFAAIYAVGRVLEPWLIKSTFRKALSGELELPQESADTGTETTARVGPPMRGSESNGQEDTIIGEQND